MSNIYEKIEKALRDSISFHNDGLSANDSIVKSASLHELNPETTCRVVEAFNIAKTRAFIKNASKRDESFDTAVKADVVKGVFGDTIKQEDKKAFEQDSGSWSFKMEKLDPTEEEYAKFASEFRSSEFDLQLNLRKAASSIHAEKNSIETLRQDIVSARDMFIVGLSKVANYFSYSHNKATAEKDMDKAAFQYSGDDDGLAVIDLVSKVAELDYEIPEILVPSDYGNSGLHEIIDGLVDDTQEYNAKVAKYNKYVDELNRGAEEIHNIASEAAGLLKKKTAASLLHSGAARPVYAGIGYAKMASDLVEDIKSTLFPEQKEQEEEVSVKAASLLKSAAPINVSMYGEKIPIGETQISDGIHPKVKDLEETGYLSRIGVGSAAKDEVANEMEDIQRQAILQDLMVNDEIISTYDPNTIESAYNTLVRLAPKASLVPDVVRSTLRYATGQSIDPHFASQLVELENNISKRNEGGGAKR